MPESSAIEGNPVSLNSSLDLINEFPRKVFSVSSGEKVMFKSMGSKISIPNEENKDWNSFCLCLLLEASASFLGISPYLHRLTENLRLPMKDQERSQILYPTLLFQKVESDLHPQQSL